jgi:hypothetical protein
MATRTVELRFRGGVNGAGDERPALVVMPQGLEALRRRHAVLYSSANCAGEWLVWMVPASWRVEQVNAVRCLTDGEELPSYRYRPAYQVGEDLPGCDLVGSYRGGAVALRVARELVEAGGDVDSFLAAGARPVVLGEVS